MIDSSLYLLYLSISSVIETQGLEVKKNHLYHLDRHGSVRKLLVGEYFPQPLLVKQTKEGYI